MIIGIVCVDKNWGIGKDNHLLFNIQADMKFFKDITLNRIICMGKNTLESFPDSKPLPGRLNIVLCNNDYERDDCFCLHSMEDMLECINEIDEDVYIVGGASMYQSFLPYYDKVLVTKVNADGAADTFFPNLDLNNQFTITNNSDIIESNNYKIQFITYEKVTR